jgi:single-stranded DNA-binding protein
MECQLGDLNMVFICGRVASVPDVRFHDFGVRQLRMLLTVGSDHPRRRIDVLPVTVWDPDDQLIDPGLGVGSRVMVSGTLQRSFWDGPEGRRSRLEVIGRQVTVRRRAELGPELATTDAQ